MKLYRFSSATLIAIALSGCVTTSSKPPIDQAVLPIPKNDQAHIYVFRNGSLIGLGTPARVIVDGKELATLWNDTYLVTSVSPGKHKVNIKWFIRVDEVTLDIEQGGRHFIETGWTGATGCFDPRAICVGTGAGAISKERALGLLADMKEINGP